MKKYSHLVYKQFKIQRKRNIYTIMGIVLGIVLLTTVLYINSFINESNIEAAKVNAGDYDVMFKDLTKNELQALKGNVKIEKEGFLYIDETGVVTVGDYQKRLAITALDNSSLQTIFNKSIVLEEGSFPDKIGQVTLEKKAKKELRKKIGDTIIVGAKTYEIVGFYEGKSSRETHINGVSYFAEDKLPQTVNAVIRVKDTGNKIEVIEEVARSIGKTDLQYNDQLFDAKGESIPSGGDQKIEQKAALVSLNVIILLLTSVVIYGAINVSMQEKIRFFATLRCIGATPDKIRYLLMKESIILGVASLFPGLLLGHLTAWIITTMTFEKIGTIGIEIEGIKIYWNNIGIVFVLSTLTIFLASVLPIIKAGKIHPIEGAKPGRSMLKNKKVKNKIIRKVFGYRGELAYKNLRARNGSFMVTTLLLSFLLVTFVTYTGYYSAILHTSKEREEGMEKDFVLSMRSKDTFTEFMTEGLTSYSEIKERESALVTIGQDIGRLDEVKKFVEETQATKDVSSYMEINMAPLIEGVTSTNDLEDKKEIVVNGKVNTMASSSRLYVYDDENFKRIQSHIHETPPTLEAFKNDGVILIDANSEFLPFQRRNVPVLQIGIGEKLKVYMDFNREIDRNMSDETIQKIKTQMKPIELNVIGRIGTKDIPGGNNIANSSGVHMIISQDFLEKNNQKLFSGMKDMYTMMNVEFNFVNESKRVMHLQEIIDYANKTEDWYIDNVANRLEQRESLQGVTILIYTTLLIALGIVIINMINHKNISLVLRSKDMGTMIAIGMTKEDMKKIIILEAVIQSVIISFIGGGLSLLALKVMYVLYYYFEDVTSKGIPVWLIGVGIVCIFVINITSSVLSLRRFKDKDVSDLMRNEE